MMWARTGKLVRPLTSHLRKPGIESGPALVFIKAGFGSLGCSDSSEMRGEAVVRHCCLLTSSESCAPGTFTN